ncbi:hypothetical protein CQW23_09937 [Capsicum baccatum]|uniref:Uncharacterized protein n=1 Tax=Capsicum baccatum TaxID=33114 RepID=A0A2G2WYB2_CAPBA|nr:hypothetical protein CQW23_09937 [Capsicum baccatum]
MLLANDDLARLESVCALAGRTGSCEAGVDEECYLVDPASSHMLVSKIKPCICLVECMLNTRRSGQPLLPINLEPQLIGRMDSQRDIERRVAQQEQARLASLAAAQVHQQNIDNQVRERNPDDEDLDDDELLNPRRADEVAGPVNRRDRQARMRPERRAVPVPFDDEIDDLDGAGATGLLFLHPWHLEPSLISLAP